MVQSLKLGGAPAGAAPKIRRVNRLPIIIAIGLVIAFLAVIMYGLTSRGLYFGGDPGIGESSGNPASTYADQLKRGVSDGIIGEPAEAPAFQPTPLQREESVNPFTPQPAARETVERQEPQLEPEAIWKRRLEREAEEQYLRERHRQRMARLQANDAAYDSPLAVSTDKLQGQTDAGSDPGANGSSPGMGQAGSAADLYSAALQAGLGGQNLDPNAQRTKEDFYNADIKELGYPHDCLADMLANERQRLFRSARLRHEHDTIASANGDGKRIAGASLGDELLDDGRFQSGIGALLDKGGVDHGQLPGQRLKAVTRGMPNRRAQASALAFWMVAIEVPAVHQPLPVATMTSGACSID